MKSIEIVVQSLLTTVCENAKQLSQNKFACVHAPVVGIELYRFHRSAIVPNTLDVLITHDVIKNVVHQFLNSPKQQQRKWESSNNTELRLPIPAQQLLRYN